MKFRQYVFFATLTGCPFVASPMRAQADVKLPAMFADHMVLQRDMEVPVWGWADAGEAVTVSVAGQNHSTVAGPDGKWQVKLAPLKVGPPLTLTVKGKNALTVNDVLVGEVWLASGQSNMDYGLGWDVTTNAAAIAAANDSQLRYFRAPQKGDLEPQADLKANWQISTSTSVKGWSAVAFYFARELREKLGVPVGILHSSYGGTAAEPWTSREALERDPQFKTVAEEQIAAMRSFPADAAAFAPKMESWIAQNNAQDKGNSGLAQGWEKPEFDDSAWKEVQLPSNLNLMGLKTGGVFWYRKKLDLLPTAAERDLKLNMGGLSGVPKIYFNGTELKENNPQPAFSTDWRTYRVPKEIVHAGAANTIAVRQHALTLNDYFWKSIPELELPVTDPKAAGNTWKWQTEQQFAPLSIGALNALPKYPKAAIQNMPGALFNAMINPLIPYAMRGVIWYQGESNAQRSLEYRRLLPMLIQDWRTRWGQGNFPFYLVQLANYGSNPLQPGESRWALLREAQMLTATMVPNTGLATAIDIGEADNIHPKNKWDVGKRLSLVALRGTYGQQIEDSGPRYNSMQVEGNAIRLHFSNATGLTVKGRPLKYFAVAGEDGKYFWADAKIDGETVIVSSPQVVKPASVRYAWADSPDGANLTNASGLPALPFRTDPNDNN